MDGFEKLLRLSLKNATGDLILSSRRGHFEFNDSLRERLKKSGVVGLTPILQTEAFALFQGSSRGVIVKGIYPLTFSQTTEFKVQLKRDEVSIGKKLADYLKVKTGDQLYLMFGRGLESASALPTVKSFRVAEILNHGIYLKDMRFVYVHFDLLKSILNTSDKINFLYLKSPTGQSPAFEEKLKVNLDPSYKLRPYWSEYSYLLEAIKIEKTTISIILQLIVLVAVFNILAFVMFVMEKKAQDFFLLRTFGLRKKDLILFWFNSLVFIWGISCVLSIAWAKLLDYSLQNLSYFKIPGEIYVLSQLSIELNLTNVLTVFLISLVWILFSAGLGYLRLRRKSILTGLRQEFN